MEVHGDSRMSSYEEEIELDLNQISLKERKEVHRKKEDRSVTAPVGDQNAKVMLSSFKDGKLKGAVTHGFHDSSAKLMASSKSYSLTKSIRNEKELIDIRGPISNEMFFSIKITPVTDDYDVKQVLGEGSFGQVKLVIHKRNQIERAMKVIKKQGVSEEEKEQMFKEVSILKQLDHPNIIKIFDMYEDEEYIYLVIE